MASGLADFRTQAHMRLMATRGDTGATKYGKRDAAVLGRSAATGRFVLRPISKRASVSVAAARSAAKRVSGQKKK